MNLLDDALAYAARGWAIIPIRNMGGGKEAMVSWKRYQRQRPTDAELRRWFSKPGVTGLAVVCGPVSGGLVVRDFDTMASYKHWADAHSELSWTLPTAVTPRPGRHVYFTGPEAYHDFGDGEYRGDSAHYVLLPPSLHPNGETYGWGFMLPDGPLPVLDPVAAGLLPADVLTRTTTISYASSAKTDAGEAPVTQKSAEREQNDSGRTRKRIESHIAGCGASLDSLEDDALRAIACAVQACVPSDHRQRNKAQFKLARTLKGMPALANIDPRTLRPVLQGWHNLALPNIRTQDFEESWSDFLRGWAKVKYPRGIVMRKLLERAKATPLPAAAHYENEALRLLAALCRELQDNAGDAEFPLSACMAAEMVGTSTKTAWRYLFTLQSDGLLTVSTPGDRKARKATRFRFIDGQPQHVVNAARMEALTTRLMSFLGKGRREPSQYARLEHLRRQARQLMAEEKAKSNTCQTGKHRL